MRWIVDVSCGRSSLRVDVPLPRAFHPREELGRSQYYLLGEFKTVYGKYNGWTIGSDESCDVIIDHPDVEPRYAEYSWKGHHGFSPARTLAPSRSP